MILAKKLSVAFGNESVFKNLEFIVSDKEQAAVIGANGSGKTTLALILAGVIPDFKSATVRGSFVCRKPALIMQNPSGQFFAMTVREELGERGIKLAKKFGAEKLLDRTVFDLSEGEKQKINLIANFSFGRPLLLDEPTELLDPFEENRFRKMIEGIGDRTVVWFDKGEEHVPAFRKIFIGGQEKAKLPAKKNNVKTESVLDADFLICRNGFCIKNVSLNIKEGEKIALIGLNGSGKTTILRALAGEGTHSGRLELKRGISFVPQNPTHLFFRETAEAELVNVKNAHSLGIGGLLRKSPVDLSKGQQKLLSVATIELNTIALMDEPTTWLDAQNRASVYNFINESRQAMVIATHDRGLLDYCDRILMVEKGGLSECSSTAANRFFRR